MTMPGDINFGDGLSYFGRNLTASVQSGTIPEARVDDMATRIIAAWHLLHQDDPSFPAVNFNAFHIDDDATNERVDVQADHFKLVREMGSAGIVLLKVRSSAAFYYCSLIFLCRMKTLLSLSPVQSVPFSLQVLMQHHSPEARISLAIKEETKVSWPWDGVVELRISRI